MFKRDVLLAQEYLGFLLLNLCDLFLTGWIFRYNGLEANPLAVWCLTHGGYSTFVLVKFALITVVVLACEGYSFKDIRVSRAIMVVGCLVYLTVVIYECFLIIKFIQKPKVDGTPPEDTQQDTSMNFDRPIMLPAGLTLRAWDCG